MAGKEAPIICLMGPTAAGKTPLAVRLVQALPCEIISVDSAMVYRGMDIGTAKPDAETLKIAPHHLIDIVDPKEAYSAGQFRVDAMRAIDDIQARGRIPLLVGGTMLYFRALQQGLAGLPTADKDLRMTLQKRAELEGWQVLHAELAAIDPQSAKRIHVSDTQRIQRALEVYLLSGKPISQWQAEDKNPLTHKIINIGLMPFDRARLHERIAQRFALMLQLGLVDEVKKLYERGDLSADLPAMRSVGYRQVWDYLAGNSTFAEMKEKAIAATRQLAKRQITWLRSWPEMTLIDSEVPDVYEQAVKLTSIHRAF